MAVETINIMLHVLDSKDGPKNGYIAMKGSRRGWYYYRYSGGAGAGAVVVEQGKPTDVVVKLDRAGSLRRYRIEKVHITGDNENDITIARKSKGEVVLSDNAEDEEHNMYYAISVYDREEGQYIYCDPRISNIP